MKILHIDSGREMRGGQWQALRLHRALIEAGHTSMLLVREGSPLAETARNCDVPHEVLRPFRLASVSRRFDLVHAHDAHSHTLSALCARVPVIVSRRVAFPVGTSLTSKWKYSRPRRFIAVSRFVASKLKEAGIAEDRIDVVYDGVDIPPTPAQGELTVTPWTADPAKGMALAEAAAKSAGIALLESKNLESDLARARLFLYLSHAEGLGSAILLAMAWGVPVVASRVGGIPEIVEDGVTGILTPNETDAIAAAIRKVDPAMGAAGREAIRRSFTVRHMTDATLASYTKALNA